MPRLTKIFINIATDEVFDGESGALIGTNSYPYISSKEEAQYSIQYVTEFSDIDNFTKYEGFAGQTTSSSAVVDNDYNHIDKGTLAVAVVDSVPITTISIVRDSLTNIPQPSGFVRLINAGSQSETIEYTSVVTNGDDYDFTVDITPLYSYSVDDIGATNDPPLIKAYNADIDSTDSATGLFVVTISADSLPFLLQIEGDAQIDGCIFEHQVKDDTGKKIFESRFTFVCNNSLDDDGVLPPPDDFNWYSATEIDALLAGKMDKVPTATDGNLGIFDTLGQLVDSGLSPADFGADVRGQSTAGLIWGDEATIGLDNESIDVDDFSGVVIDVLTNTKYDVSILAQNIPNDDLGEQLTIYALDKDSNIIQLHENIECVDARRYAVFAASITIGSEIVAVRNIAATTPYSVALSLSDLWDEIGPVTREKDLISANGANLKINMREFKTNFTAINFTNPECPNQKTMQAQTTPVMERYWSDGAGGYNIDLVTDINPTVYDDGSGTLSTIADDAFTIRTLFISPEDERISMFVGVEQFSNIEGALSKVNQTSNELNLKAIGRTFQYIGSVVTRKDTTALNDGLTEFVEFSKFEPIYDNLASLGDGLILNPVTVTYTTDGVNSTCVVTATNDPHIEIKIDGHSFEVLSPVTIPFVHGTATIPTQNYIYFTQVGSVAQLQNSIAKPTVSGVGRFANVLEALIPDAVTMNTAGVNGGARSWQKIVNYFASTSNQSWIKIVNDILRESTSVISGVTPSLSESIGGTSATISFATTSGSIRQLTPHAWPGFDSITTEFLVANDFNTPYVGYNYLNEVTDDINGDSLQVNNRRYNLVFYAMQDEDGSIAKTYCNAPDGYYTSDSQAIDDDNNTAIYSTIKGGTCQLLARVTCKWDSPSSIQVLNFVDLREGVVGGSSGSGATTFLELTDTFSDYTGLENQQLVVNGAGTGLTTTTTGSGEANTASSVGTGLSIYKSKTNLNLDFNGIANIDSNSILEITADVVNDNIDFNINETNLNAFIDAKNYITSDVSGITGADEVINIISLTQAEYNAIGTPNAQTIFNITDA